MFCKDCGNRMSKDGKCPKCTEKSFNGVSTESLEKSLQLLEDMAKGVRPGLAKKGEDEKRTPEKANDDAVEQLARHAKETEVEGDSDEEPKTKKGVEKDKFVKGFDKPMPAPMDYEDDEDPREEEDEDEEEGRPMPYKSAKNKKKSAKKSLADSLNQDKEVRDAIDVSGFLKSITDHLVDSTDTLTNRVNKSIEFASYQKGFNQALAQGLVGVAEVLKSLNAEVIKLQSQPVGQRKSDLSAAVIEKSFSIGETAAGESLTKSQIAEKLLNLRMAGDNTISSNDISKAESTGQLRPDLAQKLGLK